MLNTILEEYAYYPIAITSIGLDGEETDTITNLPKPQIHVKQFTIIATAYDCIREGNIIHERTGIMTPLGEIVIIEAEKDQDILLAGPSTKKDMIQVIKILKKYRPDKVFIDGALFRKSLASTAVSDAVIIATGASLSDSMNAVVEETVDIVEQFSVDEVSPGVRKLISDENCVIDEVWAVYHIEDIWIQSRPHQLKKYITLDTTHLYLKGALTDKIVQTLIEIREQINKLSIVVTDASHILCSSKYYRKLAKMNVDIKVMHKSHLLFVTYNPTSPYLYQFNNDKFKKLLEKSIEYPCINVLEDRK